jgi:hypothetical protein
MLLLSAREVNGACIKFDVRRNRAPRRATVAGTRNKLPRDENKVTARLRSIRALAAFSHQRGHDHGLLATIAQSRDDAGAIHLGPVLADLPLAFDFGDRNLDADDALDL